MSRAWRIEYEGALYHLLSRGNEGSDIFIDNEAYLLQLSYYIHRNPLRAGIVKRLAGYLRNEQIGNLFGISYSAVSHIVRSFKANLK